MVDRPYQLKSFSSAFQSVRLYQYFAMMFFGIMFQGFFAYVYKIIGLKEGLDDNFLAWAGSCGAIVNAVSRVGFGWLYD